MDGPVDLGALRALAGAQDYVEHINLMEAAADELAALRKVAEAAEYTALALEQQDTDLTRALAAWRGGSK